MTSVSEPTGKDFETVLLFSVASISAFSDPEPFDFVVGRYVLITRRIPQNLFERLRI
jgi:hypothetical protein